MHWIDTLERRFGRYGIPYLVNALMVGQLAVGLFILIVNWRLGLAIDLDRDLVLRGSGLAARHLPVPAHLAGQRAGHPLTSSSISGSATR